MALATQCPHCHTTFRVAHDQLKLRAGIVRCGQCRQVFNGIEHLLPPTGTPPAENPAAAPTTGSRDVGGLILPGAIHQPATGTPEAGLSSGAKPEPDSEPVSPAAEPHAGTAGTPAAPHDVLDELDYGALEGMTLIHFPPAEQPSEQDEPPLAASNAAPPEQAAPETAPLDDENTDPAAASNNDFEAQPLPRASWPEADHGFDNYRQEEPGFVTAARRQQRRQRRARRLFGAGSAILALLLLAQVAYALRNPIAAHLPQTKPALLAICRTLGCRIGLPAQIDAISIESSELQAQPATAGTLALTLLLRNRSSTVQAWPNIELTLHDGNQRAILRRVFTPREFPLSAADIAKGFAADSEQSIRLSFRLTELTAAGYRVVLFYP